MAASATAKIDDVATALVELVRAIVRVELRAAQPETVDVLDQNTSGLGRRHHCRAWREGKLRGRKVGRRILVTREDRDRYIEEHGIRGVDAAVDDIKNPIDRELMGLGFAAARRRLRSTRLTRRSLERTSRHPTR